MAALWQTMVGSGALALIAALIARHLYIRFYLSRRLFFEPWVNLSRDKSLNIGESLAELLFFELERIRKLLAKARADNGLWNDKLGLPSLERSFEGYPEFVRHADLFGLPERIAKLLRFVLLTRPPALRGTIHEFGSSVRFQVVRGGLRGAERKLPVPCWSTSIEAGKPESIPGAVSELAHSIMLDFQKAHGFKSPQTFQYFTTALNHHLAYNNFRRLSFLEEAEKYYKLAVDHEGGNSEASCNLADLLYNQFTYQANEQAIQAYLGALKTDKAALRARACRGLANAHCQRRQRHKRGGKAALEAALRWAEFASDICQEARDDLPPEEKASIKKAGAFAEQVWAELGASDPNEKELALKKAIALYTEATDLHKQFTVAYNNLSYLYLKQAETEVDQFEKDRTSKDKVLVRVTDLLQDAEKWSRSAIEKDRTFYMAYDNQGNIAATRARLKGESLEECLDRAVKCYHRALSYQPSYNEAYSDLAKAHSRLFLLTGPQALPEHHASLAWQYHFYALTHTADPLRRQLFCDEFNRFRMNLGIPPAEVLLAGEEFNLAANVKCACIAEVTR